MLPDVDVPGSVHLHFLEIDPFEYITDDDKYWCGAREQDLSCIKSILHQKFQ